MGDWVAEDLRNPESDGKAARCGGGPVGESGEGRRHLG